MDIAVGHWILERDDELHVAFNSGVEAAEEALPLVLVRRGHAVTSRASGVVDIEDLAVELIADFRKEALHGGETATQCARLDGDFKLVAVERAGVGFEDIARKVDGVVNLEGDLLALVGNFATGLDIAGPVSAVVTVGTPEEDFLEIRNIHLLHVDEALLGAARAFGGKGVDFSINNIEIVKIAAALCHVNALMFGSLWVSSNSKLFILFMSTRVVAASVVGRSLVIGTWRDPRIASRIIQRDSEREALAVHDLLQAFNNRNKSIMEFRSLGLPQRLLA